MDIIEIEQFAEAETDMVIDGVLHYFLDGAWHEYDKKCLTAMLLAEWDEFTMQVEPIDSNVH